MKYTKEEISQAKEEYDRIIDSLMQEGFMRKRFKGHWEDKEVVNNFNRKIIEKGDKHVFIPYHLENQRLIEEAKNL